MRSVLVACFAFAICFSQTTFAQDISGLEQKVAQLSQYKQSAVTLEIRKLERDVASLKTWLSQKEKDENKVRVRIGQLESKADELLKKAEASNALTPEQRHTEWTQALDNLNARFQMVVNHAQNFPKALREEWDEAKPKIEANLKSIRSSLDAQKETVTEDFANKMSAANDRLSYFFYSLAAQSRDMAQQLKVSLEDARSEVVSVYRAQLVKMDQKLKALDAKKDVMTEEARADLNEAYAELQQKWKKLELSSAEQWQEIREDFAEGWNDFKSEVKEAGEKAKNYFFDKD